MKRPEAVRLERVQTALRCLIGDWRDVTEVRITPSGVAVTTLLRDERGDPYLAEAADPFGPSPATRTDVIRVHP